MGALLGSLKEHLKDHVKDVKFSSVLVSAPSRLVGDEYDLSPFLEKIMARQGGDKNPSQKKTLEINPEHDIVKKLHAFYDSHPNSEKLADFAQLLFGHAVIADGGDLGDVVKFNKALVNVLGQSL